MIDNFCEEKVADLKRLAERIGRDNHYDKLRVYEALDEITRLTAALAERDELLADILESIKTAGGPEYTEQPSPDQPWLPVGLMVRIYEALGIK